MATLKEQLAQLSDEELLALKQEMLKKNTPEGIRADVEKFQAQGIGGVGRGLLEGATRGGRAVVSGVRELAGMSPLAEPEGASGSELEIFEEKERIKRRVAGEFEEPTGFEEEKFEFEKEQEGRRLSQEERRNLQIKIGNIESFGATIDPKEFGEVKSTTGQDISDWMERWGISKDKDGAVSSRGVFWREGTGHLR